MGGEFPFRAEELGLFLGDLGKLDALDERFRDRLPWRWFKAGLYSNMSR
jgi:hypothetical protein